jgi:hypothetical protein
MFKAGSITTLPFFSRTPAPPVDRISMPGLASLLATSLTLTLREMLMSARATVAMMLFSGHR